MKSVLPVLASALIFASCTTYKSGQTPDDVYYSPERPKDEYVKTEKQDEQRYREDESAYRDDRYIRMKIHDARYAYLYDDYMSYNPYNYHYYNSSLYFNSPWNNYTYWNYYFNPTCSHCFTCGSSPTKTITRTPRQFDLSVYTPGTYTTVKGGLISIKGQNFSSTPGYTSRNYGSGKPNTNNYGNSGRNAGSFVREAFGGSNNSNIKLGGGSSGGSSSSSSPSRGSSGGGSSNAGARKF